MSRCLAIVFGCGLALGCSGPENDFKASGKPALTLQMRRASTQPVEGWMVITRDAQSGPPLYVSPKVILSNADLASAGATVNGDSGNSAVAVRLTDAARKDFAALTTEMANAPPDRISNHTEALAIFIDGEFVSAPLVNEPVTDGSFLLQGAFISDELQARRIAHGIVRSD